MITLAIAGKPNCGKSTFYTAVTLAHAEIANYPFTTIDANHGVAYVRAPCPCAELGITCGNCHNGVRFIAVQIIDVAGLVPDAHKGRGLGNQFLDNLRQADAILHIIDASGATDEEGNPVDVGSHHPLEDIDFIQHEMTMWLHGILTKNWSKMQRSTQQKDFSIYDAIADQFAGLGITYEMVKRAEERAGIELRTCSDEDLVEFCRELISTSKPMIIVANKTDMAPENILSDLKEKEVILATAAGELALRKAEEGKFIRYMPGDTSFSYPEDSPLTEAQKKGLHAIATLMEQRDGTGVQQAMNTAVFDCLDYIVVYPVEDENKYCDGKDRVLPDAFLMKRGSNPHDLAYMVHSDIGDGFLYAVDAKTKMRIKETQELKDGDVIKIVSANK